MDVARDILLAALNAERKTRIMYRANLDTRGMRRYFAVLMEKGLLEMVDDVDNDGVLYRTTERGRIFIEGYRSVAGMVSAEPLERELARSG